MAQLQHLCIPGFPKCGTSSLFQYLIAHPSVCGSIDKEPSYLIDKNYPLVNEKHNFSKNGKSGYLECWDRSKITTETNFLLEASTHYIFQETSLRVLSSLKPLPKIIVMLRKPSERIYSAFNFTKHNLKNISPKLTFGNYVELAEQQDPLAFNKAITGTTAYIFSQQLQRSHYIDYLMPWKNAFKENLMLLLLEDLVASPNTLLNKICDFLSISNKPYQDFKFQTHNKTKVGFFASLKNLLNQSELQNDRLVLERLEKKYQESNLQLKNEFGLDLSSWGISS